MSCSAMRTRNLRALRRRNMSYLRPHFMFEESRENSASFALQLMAEMGHATLKSCDVVISIGGDGMMLHALSASLGKPVFAVTPPDSNSNGFWTHHDIANAEQLRQKLAVAEAILLTPLKADIHFTNGKNRLCYAFNDVAIERASGQSVLINLSAESESQTIGPRRIMGDGFNFSTALGSTGTNRSYHGPIVDIHNDVVIMVGKGIYDPPAMAPMVVRAGDMSFHADFASVAHKRPVRIDYDGLSIAKDNDGSLIDGLVVSAAPEKATSLLLTSSPSAKAFGAMMG